jgi:hypothetical protein
LVHCCWMSAQTFGFIDAKDALYQCLMEAGGKNIMPKTVLLPWDLVDAAALPPLHTISEPTCLLKAALGSGGHGIYFVRSHQQVLDVIQADAAAARKDVSFIRNLEHEHDGRVPRWSLQQFVQSVRVSVPDPQRCQFRVYVVSCGERMYLYRSVEVRVPQWDDDLDAALSEDTAREYNCSRNKERTHRMLLHELPDVHLLAQVSGGETCFHQLVRRAMLLLKPAIDRNRERLQTILLDYSHPFPDRESFLMSGAGGDAVKVHFGECMGAAPTLMAVAGIDLLLGLPVESGAPAVPYIVEFNNNPAMPTADKLMSQSYRAHLIKFMQHLLALGGVLSSDLLDDSPFETLW